ncbi:MAG: site-specific integrase [SAR324 cluster bacterium]|nr:site-specific integrase [SAR324 cluster bacterium]
MGQFELEKSGSSNQVNLADQESTSPEKEIAVFKGILEEKFNSIELEGAKGVMFTIPKAIEAYLTSVANDHTRRAKKSDLDFFAQHLKLNGFHTLGDLGRLTPNVLSSQIEGFLKVQATRPSKRQKEQAVEMGPLDMIGRQVSVKRYKGSVMSWFTYVSNKFPTLISAVPEIEGFKAKRDTGTTEALSYTEWDKLKQELDSVEKPDPAQKPKFRNWRAKMRLRALCYIGILAGGRRISEILKLTWADANYEKSLIRIAPSKKRDNITVYHLPFSPQLQTILKEYRASLKEEPKPTDKMFDIKPQSVDEILKRCAKKAGIRRISYHVLRSTFITWSIARGDSVSQIMNATLHTSYDTVRQYDKNSKLSVSSINQLGEI